MSEIETVKVKADSERGWKIINKSDMTDSDELFEAPKAKKKTVKKKATKK